jgi:hypothetical protein
MTIEFIVCFRRSIEKGDFNHSHPVAFFVEPLSESADAPGETRRTGGPSSKRRQAGAPSTLTNAILAMPTIEP